jgi:BA14K-like protein
MKRLLAVQTGLTYRAGALCCVLVTMMSGAALAQTTGAVDPSPATAEPSAKEEPPPGGCMPIGVTVSGEIVFPFQCRAFLERQKAANQKPVGAENENPAAAKQKPDAAEEKTVAKQSAVTDKPAVSEVKPAAAEKEPSAEEKTATTQHNSVAPENSKPATEPVDSVRLPKRVEREARERTIGLPGCTQFRTYDATSGTYRAFDGQRRQCREVAGQLFRK